MTSKFIGTCALIRKTEIEHEHEVRRGLSPKKIDAIRNMLTLTWLMKQRNTIIL